MYFKTGADFHLYKRNGHHLWNPIDKRVPSVKLLYSVTYVQISYKINYLIGGALKSLIETISVQCVYNLPGFGAKIGFKVRQVSALVVGRIWAGTLDSWDRPVMPGHTRTCLTSPHTCHWPRAHWATRSVWKGKKFDNKMTIKEGNNTLGVDFVDFKNLTLLFVIKNKFMCRRVKKKSKFKYQSWILFQTENK